MVVADLERSSAIKGRLVRELLPRFAVGVVKGLGVGLVVFAGLRYRYPQFRKALFQVKIGYFVSWAAGGAVNEAENHMRVFEHVVAQEEHAKRAQYLDDMADQGKFQK